MSTSVKPLIEKYTKMASGLGNSNIVCDGEKHWELRTYGQLGKPGRPDIQTTFATRSTTHPFGSRLRDCLCDCKAEKEAPKPIVSEPVVQTQACPIETCVCKYAKHQPLPSHMPSKLRFMPAFETDIYHYIDRTNTTAERNWRAGQKTCEMRQAHAVARKWVQRNMREWPICNFGHTVEIDGSLNPGMEMRWICWECWEWLEAVNHKEAPKMG